MKITTTWLWIALIVVGCVAWFSGCQSKAPPPQEMADDLKLTAKQREGMTADELDRAYLRWTAKQKADAETKKADADKAAVQAKEETQRQEEATAALIEQRQAEGQVDLDALQAEYNVKASRLKVAINKDARQIATDGRLLIVAINNRVDDVVKGFRDWTKEQTDRQAAVAGGVASAHESIEQQDFVKTTLASLGAQAATPYLPAGILAGATGLIGNLLGKRSGNEGTRALLGAINAAGVNGQVAEKLPDHAEPADAGVIAKLANADGIQLQAPKAPKLAA